jgi:hypothetical protein
MIGGTDILKQMAIERATSPAARSGGTPARGCASCRKGSPTSDFDKETDRRMAETINKGSVVVTSYTAPWIIDEGFKVWISASKGDKGQAGWR